MLSRTFLAAVLALSFAAPSIAAADDSFGAIAYSPSTNIPGSSKNYGSKDEAAQAAMESCKENGGADDCKLVNEYKNTCASLALGDGGWGTAYDDDQATSDSMATAQCSKFVQNCKIVVSICTGR